jgi:hypothetical protein
MPDPLAPDPFEDDRGLEKKKLRQLCRQVERALRCAFADDARLLDLRVAAVLPWPNASRLLVAVHPERAEDAIDRPEILARLDVARPELQRIAAGAVHRKRAPSLTFEVIPDAAALTP